MAEDIPLWMDNNFFTTILEKDHQQKVNILKFDVKPAVGPGYNYTSKVLRVKVNYLVDNLEDEQSISLVIKIPLSGEGVMNDLHEKMDFYGKEPTNYDQFLPFIFKNIKVNLGPKGYFSPQKDVMVMEDIKVGGYVVIKTLEQLDYDHCEKVMEAIAKFHACSVKCSKENPKLIKNLGEEALWVKGTVCETWMNIGTKIVLDLAKELNGDPRFIDFLQPRLDTFYDGIVKTNQPKQNGFNVLNHGDLWASNMMFKHDSSGKPIDVKFIDFQITRWASPVADLTYFIWSSASEEVRASRITELYRVYLSTLNTTLQQLGCEERLAWEELESELKSAYDWGLVMVCLCLPVMTTFDEDVLDLGNFKEEDYHSEEFKSLYRKENYLSVLPAVLKQFSDYFLSK